MKLLLEIRDGAGNVTGASTSDYPDNLPLIKVTATWDEVRGKLKLEATPHAPSPTKPGTAG